jgi:hypothetical protein
MIDKVGRINWRMGLKGNLEESCESSDSFEQLDDVQMKLSILFIIVSYLFYFLNTIP